MSDEGAEVEPEPVYAYVDTNAFLEFGSPDQVKWCEAAGEQRLRLVITPVVIRELQQAKDNKTRVAKKRTAAERIKWLEQSLSNGNSGLKETPVVVKDGVDMVFEGAALPPRVFDEHQLDPGLPDDRLVAHALVRRAAGSRVILVTNDAGPRLLGRSLGLPCFDLPDRPEQSGAATQTNPTDRMPNLDLGFWRAKEESRRFLPVQIARPVPRAERKQFLASVEEELRIRYALAKQGQGPASFINLVSERDYRESCAAFMTQAEKALSNEADVRRTQRLEIVIRNTGTRHADVEVVLELPDGLDQVWTYWDRSNYVEFDAIPLPEVRRYTIPRSTIGRAARRLKDWSGTLTRAKVNEPRVVHDPDGRWQAIGGPFLFFPKFEQVAPKGFTVKFEIHEPGLAAPMKGDMNVKVMVLEDDMPGLPDLGAFRNRARSV